MGSFKQKKNICFKQWTFYKQLSDAQEENEQMDKKNEWLSGTQTDHQIIKGWKGRRIGGWEDGQKSDKMYE